MPEQPGEFYTPPDPLPDLPAGSLLREEALDEPLPAGAVGRRILYLSTDREGSPIAVSGLVIVPGPDVSGPHPVIAWAHGTVGVLPECGVSHTSDPFQQTPAIERMLAAGFAIVATDYPALGTPGVHPYLVGTVAARSVLDAVRAARALDSSVGDRFAVWGASQGGHASLWTAQEQQAYAPELELVAAAASAPASDLAAIAGARWEDKAGGVLISELLYAWSEEYDLDLEPLIEPESRERVDKMARACFTTPGAFLLVGGIVTPDEFLRVDFRTVEPWRGLLEANTPRAPISVPLLLTQGTADEVVPPPVTRAEAERRCSAGESVRLVMLDGVKHDAREESADVTIAWLADRFAGLPVEEACAF